MTDQDRIALMAAIIAAGNMRRVGEFGAERIVTMSVSMAHEINAEVHLDFDAMFKLKREK